MSSITGIIFPEELIEEELTLDTIKKPATQRIRPTETTKIVSSIDKTEKNTKKRVAWK
jgi:hypothetical protein